ncbi:MAG: hypothetical protein LBS90_04855 [Oscillospiraceae bacterium]|jgi:hypothetical protein|nr:hypothetical protein [Oscillospiraceae bacterium]
MKEIMLVAAAVLIIAAVLGLKYVNARFQYKQTKSFLDPHKVSFLDPRLAEFPIETSEDLERYMTLLEWVDDTTLAFEARGGTRTALLTFPDGRVFGSAVHSRTLEKADLKASVLQRISAGGDPEWTREDKKES